jgi:diguanylate cyclase (GGDEF)-like protein/PAS domain S-box-containing protein
MPMPKSMQAALDLLPDAILVVQKNSMAVDEANIAACAVLDYTRDELCGMSLPSLCPPQDVGALAKRFEAAGGKQPSSVVFRTTLRGKSGQAHAVEWSVSQFRQPDGDYWMISARPLAASRLASASGETQTEPYGLGLPGHDPLTGLPDRRLFERRLERAIHRGRQRDGYRFAICFIDLDHFKMINDSFGHLTGDRVLCEVARRLVCGIRAGDMAARFGGDEFTVFLDDLNAESDAVCVAERILDGLQEAVTVDDSRASVKASIGIAAYSTECRTLEDMLHRADQAMYRAKALGGDRCSI